MKKKKVFVPNQLIPITESTSITDVMTGCSVDMVDIYNQSVSGSWYGCGP